MHFLVTVTRITGNSKADNFNLHTQHMGGELEVNIFAPEIEHGGPES